MTTAELLACSADVSLELVTPERFFAPEVGGLNHVPYARALHEAGARITINTRLVSVRRDGDELVAVLGSDYAPRREERKADGRGR